MEILPDAAGDYAAGELAQGNGAPGNRFLPRGLDRCHKIFGGHWDATDANAGRVFDCVDDGGSGAVERKFADALGTRGSARVGQFFEVDTNRRQIHGSGHDVVRHLVVDHAAFLPDDFLVESEADALCDATFHLARREDGIDHASNFLYGDEIFDASFVRRCVNGNFRDIYSPTVCAVGVAAIEMLIPMNIWRRGIAAGCAQRADFVVITAARGDKGLPGGS